MERQIGEKFIDNGVELEVVEGYNCLDCDIKECINNNSGLCFSITRKDRKSVIFKQVKKSL